MNNINNSRFFKKTIQKAIKKRAIQPNCQHIKYSPYIEKSNSTLKKINQLICVSLVFTQPLSALAYEVTQDLEVGVISTAVIQFANFNNVVTDGGRNEITPVQEVMPQISGSICIQQRPMNST